MTSFTFRFGLLFIPSASFNAGMDCRWLVVQAVNILTSPTPPAQVDGADSSKHYLPHLKRRPKETLNPDYMLKMNVVGVKYNGLTADDLYYFTNNIAKDSNATCTILWLTLLKVRLYCTVCHQEA